MEILTANELVSGAVVYLDEQNNWVMDIEKARRFGADETEARDAIMAVAAATDRLVSLDTEIVELVNGKVRPQRLRERIRATGPTAPYGPERQELGEDGHVSL